MVENCVPWYCWHNWEGGGGKRMVQRGGGGNVPNFGLRKSKSGPIQNPQQSSTIACTDYSVLPLGGCGDELALLLRLAFGTGLLSDSNVRRIGNEGFSDWCCTAQETWKPLQPRTSERIPARKRKISARLPIPRFPPPLLAPSDMWFVLCMGIRGHLLWIGCTPRGSCNRTLLARLLRRFSNSKCLLEGFLEGACKGLSVKTRFLEGFLEGSIL